MLGGRAPAALAGDATTESDLALVQRRELAALEQAYATPEHREAVAAFSQALLVNPRLEQRRK